jgi:UDP-N-acetyl-alpha-D-quinovosamine dehydrogenase
VNSITGRFLVTGANGFVGRQLTAKIARRGGQFRAALRASSPHFSDNDSVILCRIDGRTDWAEALRDIDVVIHLAARVHVMHENSANPLEDFRRSNVNGTEHLARSAAACGVKRMVYVSTIKVNGESTRGNQEFTEADAPSPQDPYGISKWEAEQILWRIASQTGLEIVVVRPPLVYGPGVKGNFMQMLSVVARGYPLPFASVANLRSLIYVENLADALIACATQPAAAGQTYLVSDGEDVSTPDLLRRLAAEMEVPSRLFACPVSMLNLAGRLTGKTRQFDRLLGSLRVDSGKIRSDLNWVPPYSLQQGLRATAEWYRTEQNK